MEHGSMPCFFPCLIVQLLMSLIFLFLERTSPINAISNDGNSVVDNNQDDIQVLISSIFDNSASTDSTLTKQPAVFPKSF